MKEQNFDFFLFSLFSKLNLQLTMSLAASLLGIASPGLAIPSTTPHPHDNPNITDAATTWLTNPNEAVADPDPDMPNRMEHQHRDRHPLNGQLIPGSGGDVTNTVNIGGGLGFGTYAVWDDRNWRYDRANDRSLQQYAHGFIRQGQNTAVRYRFVDAFDNDNNPQTPDINRWFTDPVGINMRTGINNAYNTWETAVNGTQLNVNGIPVVRSIDFMEVRANAAAEIDVLLTGGPAFIPTDLDLLFPLRGDYDFDDTNGIGATQFDFNYLSLHETGHSLGLGHFGTMPMINLMNNAVLGRGVNGSGIDAGSQDGARDLYTIPVPISQRERVRATIGSQQNPTVSFDSTTSRLSFSSGVINFADLDGGFSKSVDQLFCRRSTLRRNH